MYPTDVSEQRVQARLSQMLDIAGRYSNPEYDITNLDDDVAHGSTFVYSLLKSGATENQLRKKVDGARHELYSLSILVLEEMVAKGIQEFRDSPSSKEFVTS